MTVQVQSTHRPTISRLEQAANNSKCAKFKSYSCLSVVEVNTRAKTKLVHFSGKKPS